MAASLEYMDFMLIIISAEKLAIPQVYLVVK